MCVPHIMSNLINYCITHACMFSPMLLHRWLPSAACWWWPRGWSVGRCCRWHWCWWHGGRGWSWWRYQEGGPRNAVLLCGGPRCSWHGGRSWSAGCSCMGIAHYPRRGCRGCSWYLGCSCCCLCCLCLCQARWWWVDWLPGAGICICELLHTCPDQRCGLCSCILLHLSNNSLHLMVAVLLLVLQCLHHRGDGVLLCHLALLAQCRHHAFHGCSQHCGRIWGRWFWTRVVLGPPVFLWLVILPPPYCTEMVTANSEATQKLMRALSLTK